MEGHEDWMEYVASGDNRLYKCSVHTFVRYMISPTYESHYDNETNTYLIY